MRFTLQIDDGPVQECSSKQDFAQISITSSNPGRKALESFHVANDGTVAFPIGDNTVRIRVIETDKGETLVKLCQHGMAGQSCGLCR